MPNVVQEIAERAFWVFPYDGWLLVRPLSCGASLDGIEQFPRAREIALDAIDQLRGFGWGDRSRPQKFEDPTSLDG